MVAWNAKELGLAARHGRHDHWAAREQVDVAGELARPMHHDDGVAVGRVLNFDLARLDDEEIDIALAGLKDDLAIGAALQGRQ